jgi:hypothetical protein
MERRREKRRRQRSANAMREEERPGGPRWPKGRIGRWVAGPKFEGIFFRIKIGFLNISRLWKFIQGDLEGNLIWGFFLNSSLLLNDFRII